MQANYSAAAGFPLQLPQLGQSLAVQMLLDSSRTPPAENGASAPQQQETLPPKPDHSLALAATLASMVHAMAKTVRDLSSLPGASQFITPDMATVVEGITQPTAALAQRNLMPSLINNNSSTITTNNNKDATDNMGHASNPLLVPDSTPKHKGQQPTTPPAQYRQAPAQQQQEQSPVTPATGMYLQALPITPIMPATAQHMSLASMAGVSPVLQDHVSPTLPSAGLAASTLPAVAPLLSNLLQPPVQQRRPHRTSHSTTDYSDSDSEENGSGSGSDAKVAPSSKRACTDVLMAQRALAAVMGMKQQQQQQQHLLPALQPGSAALSSLAAPLAHLAFPPVPATLMGGSQVPTGLFPGLFLQQPKLAGAASISEMMEAAEILTSMHSLDASSEEQEQEQEQDDNTFNATMDDSIAMAPAAAAAFVVSAPAAKPRRRPAAAAKKTNKKRDKAQGEHFRQQIGEMPEETHAALRQMWEAHGQALPVVCSSREGVRADGLFKLVDGKKKILTADGACLDPVEFERLGGRCSTRNWQISILIAGLHTKPGCRTIMCLGQATRILGIHYPL